ncbi:MAG: ABC transporter ATP-binding protein [Planctomycetes bacterium]|nr:ABC transporter ATP-binding protein [Planctomycetota bacterium]
MNRGAFELRHVSKRYDGQAALSAVNFTIEPGQHVAILGTSGCGKSTALRLLAGLDTPSEGEVLLNGAVVSTAHTILMPPHLRGVSMVFQDLALWPNLSVIENVRLGLSGASLSRRKAATRAEEALRRCGIESLANRLPNTLSGGEQQRVALARAIAPRPDFLFLDEPFAGLDLITRNRLLAEIQALAGEQQFTIVLVTHDPLETTMLCLSAVVLDGGRVEATGPLDELLRSPKSELLEAFHASLRRDRNM